jgi:hypothetical protein
MAYNKEAKRLFDWFGYQLPHAIEHYCDAGLPSKTAHALRDILDDMPDSEDKEQLIRVLNWKAIHYVREDKYRNPRLMVSIECFMKDPTADRKFVSNMVKGVFRKYSGKNPNLLVTTASSPYQLLAKVIMVLGKGD